MIINLPSLRPFPHVPDFYNELDSRFYVCVTGANRSGKDLLAWEIASHYGDRGLVS